MILEIYTQRFQDFGEELQGTLKAGEDLVLPPELAQDLVSIELRSVTTDHVFRWYWEDKGNAFTRIS